MKNRHRMKCSIIVWILMIGLLFGDVQTYAATITKTQKTYDIAVVFDNSGSMYQNEAWSRAKYAMEIFASMMNYENGDKLQIFPMWEVTTDGSAPVSGGSYSAVEIKSSQDIDKISNMFTVNPGNTPFAPITEAYDYLSKSEATEKWLIVLTDGAFNEDVRGEAMSIDLQNRLSKLASSDIKVQYLGFGNATSLESTTNFYAKKSSDTSLKDDLIGICNSIFQRSKLDNNKLSNGTLTLDLSMKNLIIFVQGADAEIESLTDKDGNEIKKTLDSGQRTYSEIKANGYETAPTDRNLAGQVVTFASCPKGTYTLNYSGAELIQVFYEPDVDINVVLKNADGQTIDTTESEISSGEYSFYYSIIDSMTGEDAVQSGLLGDDVKTTAFLVTEGQEEKEIQSGDTVVLEPGTKTYFKVIGTYLKDYIITTETNKEAYTFQITQPPEKKLVVRAESLQSQSWYVLKKHDEWKPIRFTVELDGKPLSEEQFNQLTWNTVLEGIPYRIEYVPEDSACDIYIGRDSKNQFVEPEKGSYNLKTSVSMEDEYGRTLKAEDTESFEVQSYSAIWRWLFYVLLLLLIAAIILFYMSRKVMPNGMFVERIDFVMKGRTIANGGEVSYNKNARTLSIDSIPVPGKMDAECHVSFRLMPIDRRWTRSSRRRVAVIGVSADGLGENKINLDGTVFIKNKEGDWVIKSAPDDAINEKIRNATIKVDTKYSKLNCSLSHK